MVSLRGALDRVGAILKAQDELGRLRAEPGDPGSKGHFLLNRKIPQESETLCGAQEGLISVQKAGLRLPAIIQTMCPSRGFKEKKPLRYLIDDKDREHAAAMSLLSNQKEEVRAREVAVLQAQMTSERAASEATLHDTNRPLAKK